jgi:hypothetical protein
MQEVNIVAGGPPEVRRPDRSPRVYLTFEGLRDSRTIADKLTRVQLTLPLAEARRPQERLGQRLSGTKRGRACAFGLGDVPC